MARKKETLTPRQRQSRRIMREKATRKKRRDFLRKLAIGGGALCALLALAGGIFAWKTGWAERTAQIAVNGAWQITSDAGFAVQSLYLEGRSRTPMKNITEALAVKKGMPILRLDLGDMRARLEALESVRFAAVERELPGKLYVRIVEREPAALWQHKGKLTLVDDNGVTMSGIDIAPHRHLPLIVGEDAPKHVGELLAILDSEPALAERFSAAVRVGERRWNVRLTGRPEGAIEVRLPQSNPLAAWKKLAELQSSQRLLDRDVKVIDLRVDGRLFIKLTPESAPQKAASGAKET